MTPSILLKDLVKELKEYLKDFRLKNVEDLDVPLNIYEQKLPLKESKNDTKHFPYILVQTQDGTGEVDENTQQVIFIIGTYSKDTENNGHQDVFNVMQKIETLIRTKIAIGNFTLKYPIQRYNELDDTYPFYFGSMLTPWQIGMNIQDQDLI